MSQRRSKAEQETVIRRAADELEWDVFSEDPKIIRKLQSRFGDGQRVPGGEGYRWLLPPSAISIRKPPTLNEAQRLRMAGNLKKTIAHDKDD